ncbi:MAG: orotidine-5'-phosphate decarboxylase, partial [Alphaproteobacteria bacterium]
MGAVSDDRLIVALDFSGIDEARRLVAVLDETVGFYKLGLQLALAPGAEAFLDDLLAAGKRVFLDYKFYDIGETVRHAVARAAERGVDMLTVHAVPQVMAAAVAGRGAAPTRLLAVTVLTSLDDADLRAMGHNIPAAELVEMRARQALEAGCDGIVASPREAAAMRRLAGERPFLVVTPGIRPAGAAMDDQKRAATPAEAIAAGA